MLLFQPQQDASTTMQIFVFIQTWKIYPIGLKVDARETIGEVKAMIQKLEAIPTSTHWMFYRNQRLEDGRTLAGYGIGENSDLYLCPVYFT